MCHVALWCGGTDSEMLTDQPDLHKNINKKHLGGDAQCLLLGQSTNKLTPLPGVTNNVLLQASGK